MSESVISETFPLLTDQLELIDDDVPSYDEIARAGWDLTPIRHPNYRDEDGEDVEPFATGEVELLDDDEILAPAFSAAPTGASFDATPLPAHSPAPIEPTRAAASEVVEAAIEDVGHPFLLAAPDALVIESESPPVGDATLQSPRADEIATFTVPPVEQLAARAPSHWVTRPIVMASLALGAFVLGGAMVGALHVATPSLGAAIVLAPPAVEPPPAPAPVAVVPQPHVAPMVVAASDPVPIPFEEAAEAQVAAAPVHHRHHAVKHAPVARAPRPAPVQMAAAAPVAKKPVAPAPKPVAAAPAKPAAAPAAKRAAKSEGAWVDAFAM